MKPDEIRHLLGGYASGTLSEAEQKLLFEAALEDQLLFDAMADEQALKDLLDDPESRGYLQAVLDEPRLEQPHHELVAARSVMSAPAPAQAATPSPPEVMKRGPSMWWGLLAAASLALVSVVGILRLDRNTSPTQIAKNEPQPPKSASAPRPADKTLAPPPEPARASTIKAPKPLTDSKTADKKASANEAEKNAEKDAKAVAAGKAVEMATEVRKQQDARKPEALARREEQPIAPAIAIPPPPPPAPQQAPTPASSNAGPPPAPQQQNAMGNAREPSFRAAQQQPAGQDQLKVEALPLSARQLYFAGGSGLQPDALSSTLEASKEQTASRDRASAKRKAASPAPGAAGGMAAPKGALAQGRTTAVALPPSKPGFAMRYQLLHRAGAGFAPVPPGTRFRIGEEVVVVIEKNSGGMALINRVAEDGSTTPVAMSIQTNEQARSVPLTVTGPIDLVLVLSRTNAPRGISGQQSAQQTEVADGRVYVAEPSVAADQSLLARITIRVE